MGLNLIAPTGIEIAAPSGAAATTTGGLPLSLGTWLVIHNAARDDRRATDAESHADDAKHESNVRLVVIGVKAH